ncbi:hypothetical protein CASFOL_035175 [Castilleja foliolosa]|uniref:DRBM domain-containing protein n=1 Tax=Castilleja foliolosa TaxID=1961234 RepID=A0ABD3BRV5_9LAMI
MAKITAHFSRPLWWSVASLSTVPRLVNHPNKPKMMLLNLPFNISPLPSDQRGKGVEKTSNEKEIEGSIYSEDITAEHSENFEKHDEFKNKLQMYAQKKNLNLPVYRTEKEGLCFTARVSIGGDWFRSLQPCETIEEAQDSAAQSALLSLSTDAFLENDPSSYKTLLHELAKSEGFFTPMYTTIGSDRFRTFSSTVNVEGEVFQGEIAKSKKLAELSAAKAAYTELIERKLFQHGNFSLRFSDDDIFKLAPLLGSVVISDPQESPKSESQVQEITGGNEDIIYKAKESAKADCGKKKSTEVKSYLLCNRVEVFTSIPNMPLPEGTVLLPIKENMWTIVTLEFPNEKGT